MTEAEGDLIKVKDLSRRQRYRLQTSLIVLRPIAWVSTRSGEYTPDVDEFEVTGLTMAQASKVDAPYVAEAPAVLECTTFKEVSLGTSESTLVIGEIHVVRLCPEARELWDRDFLDVREWVPVGRLWGGLYSLVTDTPQLERPKMETPS